MKTKCCPVCGTGDPLEGWTTEKGTSCRGFIEVGEYEALTQFPGFEIEGGINLYTCCNPKCKTQFAIFD
jgi:hypothetical protein